MLALKDIFLIISSMKCQIKEDSKSEMLIHLKYQKKFHFKRGCSLQLKSESTHRNNVNDKLKQKGLTFLMWLQKIDYTRLADKTLWLTDVSYVHLIR